MNNSGNKPDRNGSNGRRAADEADHEIQKLRSVLKRAVASESAPGELRERIMSLIRGK